MSSEQARINEAKAIVAMAFRSGPIEDVHAGAVCPTCSGEPKYSHITEQEMKNITKRAVDRVYGLLRMKNEHPAAFDALVQFCTLFTAEWDDPALASSDTLWADNTPNEEP